MNPCQQSTAHFVWIDLEMTGLDANKDVIVEIACLITNGQLEEMAQGPDLVIGHPAAVLESMNPVVRELHTKSGLLPKIQESSLTMAQAEEQVLAFVKKYCQEGKSPLCGNSVWMDRLFLKKYMPKLEAYLHYRVLDVSSFKLAINCWYGAGEDGFYKKNKVHRALDDIRESIAELAFYRRTFFKDPASINH